MQMVMSLPILSFRADSANFGIVVARVYRPHAPLYIQFRVALAADFNNGFICLGAITSIADRLTIAGVSQKTKPPRKTAKNNEITKLSSKEPSRAVPVITCVGSK